ncbi:hypothetical protein DFH27DRAFT_488709 [Peziza echinospora]|nr:hypothetical protein DFH27DRAFT_488709 [Peziza echinospora]
MRQTPHILAQHPEASARSVYYPAAIPRLEPSFTTPFPPATIKVIDGDTYTVGQTVLLAGAGGGTNPRKGKVAVINLASELRPGGGWKNGSLAQEESLCYRSTLFATLDNKNHYPLTPIGIVYSPGVVVFRKEMKDHFAQYTDAHERFILSVVSVAGLRRPPVNARTGEFSSPSLQILLDEKIRQTLRVLVLNEQEYIVLGALGCGAFDNPPELVAKTFLRILGEPEWKGRFREIVFAVMAGNGRQVLATRRSTEDSSMEVDDPAPEPSPGRVNYLKFHALLDGVVIG